MTGAPAWLEALARRLAKTAPADLLLLSPAPRDFAELLARRLPAAAITSVDAPGHLAELRRHAAAVVAGMLETLSPQAARELLAALRDRLAASVVVRVERNRTPLGEAELLALGYRLLARDAEGTLFGFDLYDYKDRPDWLNPKNWAHPERWDKDRW